MAPRGEGSRLSVLILLHSHWIRLSLAKGKAGHDAIPADDSCLTFSCSSAQSGCWSMLWICYISWDIWQSKASQLFPPPLRAAIPSEFPIQGERGQCTPSSLCLLPWGTDNIGLFLARRWLQEFTCTGIVTRAIQGLILFSGLKIFPPLLCNISLSSGDGSIFYSCPIIQSSACSHCLFLVLILALSALGAAHLGCSGWCAHLLGTKHRNIFLHIYRIHLQRWRCRLGFHLSSEIPRPVLTLTHW